MKRFTALILSVMIFALTAMPATQAFAADVRTEYFEDGSYLVYDYNTVDTDDAESAESFLSKLIAVIKKIINLLFGKNSTTQGQRYVHYYDKNDVRLWSVYLEAEFSYNGKTASCTHADIKYYIYDSDWKMLSAEAIENGATATATFKVRQYKLGVTLKTIEKTLTLTCDKNGNVK